jgi:hypothetical protein
LSTSQLHLCLATHPQHKFWATKKGRAGCGPASSYSLQNSANN